MSLSILRIVLVLFALLNAVIGLAALTVPRRLAGAIGYELTDTAAFGEMRAVYGGLFLALGVAVALALQRHDGAGWLMALGVLYVGLASGRLISALLDGPVRYTLITLLVEVGGAALLIYSSLRLEDVG
ncbi:MAG: DUF4345 family protein [Acidobacteriota bacterium]